MATDEVGSGPTQPLRSRGSAGAHGPEPDDQGVAPWTQEWPAVLAGLAGSRGTARCSLGFIRGLLEGPLALAPCPGPGRRCAIPLQECDFASGFGAPHPATRDTNGLTRRHNENNWKRGRHSGFPPSWSVGLPEYTWFQIRGPSGPISSRVRVPLPFYGDRAPEP